MSDTTELELLDPLDDEDYYSTAEEAEEFEAELAPTEQDRAVQQRLNAWADAGVFARMTNGKIKAYYFDKIDQDYATVLVEHQCWCSGRPYRSIWKDGVVGGEVLFVSTTPVP